MAANQGIRRGVPRTWAGGGFAGFALQADDFGTNIIPGSALTANGGVRRATSAIPTVPTTGDIEINLFVPVTGTLNGCRVTFKDALAADNTNYVDFSLIDKGALGVGTTQLLDTTVTDSRAANLNGLVAYKSHVLALTLTLADRLVIGGEVLTFKITHHGTLPNTLTEGAVLCTILPDSS